MAGLSLHARNIAADPRLSVTLADMTRDVMVTPRLTLSGHVEAVSDTSGLQSRYIERFPKSKLYLSLPDALLFRVRVEAVQLNGGPGRNANRMTPDDLVVSPLRDDGLIAALNLGDCAGRLAQAAGARGTGWRVSTVDADGVDLTGRDTLARLWFPASACDRISAEAMIASALLHSEDSRR